MPKIKFRALSALSLIFLTVINLDSARADCGWTEVGADCPAGRKEVFSDGYYESESFNKLCCDKPKEIEEYRKEAKGCRRTNCMPIGTKNPCTAGSEYFYDRMTHDGKRLEGYLPVRNASCTIGGRKKGVGYSCCLPKEEQLFLATGLGAEYLEFPHQAKLPGCGGTVYNNRWIVTAAHCVVGTKNGKVNQAKDMTVKLGSDIDGVNEDSRIYKVEEIRVHEKYSQLRNHSYFGKGKYFNDIALVKVTKDIVFDESVKPLRIAPEGMDPSEFDNRLVIVGWGKTDTGYGSSFLQKGATPIRTPEQCYGTRRVPSVLEKKRRRRRQTYEYSLESQVSGEGEEYTESGEDEEPLAEEDDWIPWEENAGIKDGVICIGGIINGTYGALSWSGDSGGPAICRSKSGEAILCGVSSFGSQAREFCAKDPTKENCRPSFYTRASKYTSWVKGIAGEQPEVDIYKPYLFGKDTRRGDYPHQMQITSRDGKCGGTLLKGNKVITAAQCVVDANKNTRKGLKVLAKVHDLKDKGERYKITNVHIHDKLRKITLPFRNIKSRDYNRTTIDQDVYFNDIAILTLDRDVTGVRRFPVIPETSTEPYSDMGVELSWRKDPKYSSVLQSRDYKLLSQMECKERLDRMKAANVEMKTDPSIICAVEKYSGGSSCDRELGGGVICKDKRGREVLCGIQVIRLCYMAFPNGFLNTAHYSRWIQSALAA